MNHASLHAELQLPAYANLTDAQAAAALNAVSVFVPTAHFVSYRTIRSLLGAATTNAIAAAVSAADPLGHQMLLVPGGDDGSGGGVDASLAEFQGMVDTLAAAMLLTSEEATQIKALGGPTVSRASQIGCTGVTEADVAWVRASWSAYTLLVAQVRDRWNANQTTLAEILSARETVPSLAALDAE